MFGIDLITLIQGAGYIGVAAIIFAESGLFFGFFLPGDSLLFTAGLLASKGFFDITTLVILTWVAAVAGDSVGYLFGSKVGGKIFVKDDGIFFRKSYIEKTRIFYEKYGTKTIIFARFVPIVRTFAPIMAGVGMMRYRTFLIYNIVGGALWAGGLTILGYFLGNVIPNIDRYIIPIIALIVIVSVIPNVVAILKDEDVRAKIKSFFNF